jgi:serine/threonine protein phosphatase PrpC
VFDCAEIGCWAVVDGMGGHRGGDVAAQTVIDQLRTLMLGAPIISEDMVDALHRANDAIHRNNMDFGLQAGATVVAAIAEQGRISIAWAGDSRAYRIRNGVVAQLTRDHSFVQEMVDAGLLSPSAAEQHPKSNIVTRALGVNASASIDQVEIEFLPGDRFLLCSDGLSRSLRNEELSSPRPIQELASALLDSALVRDGSDNVSLVLFETSRPDQQPAQGT